VRNDGVPIVGFTWYSLTDQVDWDSALRVKNGNVNPLGLFDLDRNIRKVGEEYRKLIAAWRDVLPTQSICLTVPVVPIEEIGSAHEARQASRAEEIASSEPASAGQSENG
jgi:hypothetical protein